MTIIDFATAAQRTPRAFPNARAHAAARLILADAPSGDAPVLDPHRLLLAASELPEHAMFLVDLVANPTDGRLNRLEFALAGPQGDLDAGVIRAAQLIAPSARFKVARAEEDATLSWSALSPAPEIHDAGVDADGAPRSVWLAPSDPLAADFRCTLAVAEAAGVVRLRIVVRPRVLREDERAAVLHRVMWRHRADQATAQERLMVLSRWCEAGRGAVVTAEVAATQPLEDGALDCITMALFGRARQTSPAREGGLVVDLRCAATPAALPAFRFLPTAADLRQRWRASEEDATPHPGSVIVGLDAAGDPVRLAAEDRMRHLFLIGATGSGKTTLMDNMIRQDIAGGEGVVLIDPHGDFADKIRNEAKRIGRDDITIIDPSDPACPVRLDLMNTPGVDPELERSFVVNQLILLFSKQMYAGIPEAFGPIFESYFRNTCYLLMLAKRPEDRNLLLMQKVFADEAFREKLIAECEDKQVREFFTIAHRVKYDASFDNLAPYISSKLSAFADSPRLRQFFDPSSGERVSLHTMLDEGRIVVFRLPKGVISDLDVRTLGALILIQLCSAMMGRARQSANERRPVRVYIDEFQNLATRNAAEMLAEIRKYGGALILANQSLAQLEGGAAGADVARAVLANCGSMAVFRTGVEDARLLSPYLAPRVTADELLDLAVGDFIARRLVRGAPQPAQYLRGEPPPLG